MTNLVNKEINFLDLETTGTSFYKDRIIEVYVGKYINGELVKEFNTTINPGFKPDPFILKLTNIKYRELLNSPSFVDVSRDLYNFLGEELLVAHNARFDYGFLKSEFQKVNYILKNEYLCTVKLSRILYPEFKRHNLDSIIQRFEIPIGDRHRAKYDTLATSYFFFKVRESFSEEIFDNAYTKALKKNAVPENLLNFDFSKLPEKNGVYFFLNSDNYPIYIGKSNNIKKRVLSHLYSDVRVSKEYSVNKQTIDIQFITTAGNLGAELRESYLIKEKYPIYNRMLRKSSSMVKLIKELDSNGYINIKTVRDSKLDISELDNVLAVFENIIGTKEILSGIAKKNKLCPRFLGLEKGKGECFSYQIGLCDGACINKITAVEHNERLLNAFKNLSLGRWPYNEPILIIEKDIEDYEVFLVDKWCLIGSTKGEGELIDSNLSINKYTFNLDTYKILKRSLASQNCTILPYRFSNNLSNDFYKDFSDEYMESNLDIENLKFRTLY